MSTRILNDHIEITPGISGGKPRIKGHRITVQNIVIWYDRLGKSPDEIASEYELSLADIHAALNYYFDNREEIDQSIHEDNIFAENLKNTTHSNLKSRLKEISQDD